MVTGQGRKPFRVLRIDELTRVGDTGSIERYYRHTIKSREGVLLTIDVEEKNFTPEKVEPILSKKAIEADKILTL